MEYGPFQLPILTSLPLAALIVFMVGFFTVMMPGPILVAASRFSVGRSTSSAAAFLATVVSLDALVCLLMALGLEPVLAHLDLGAWLMPAGGLVILVLGVLMARAPVRAGKARADLSFLERLDHPVPVGVLVPISSPGFWIWWATAGAAIIAVGHQWGWLGLGVVLVAYLAGISAWYTILVMLLERGRRLIAPKALRATLVVLGVLMVAAGLVIFARATIPLLF